MNRFWLFPDCDAAGPGAVGGPGVPRPEDLGLRQQAAVNGHQAFQAHLPTHRPTDQSRLQHTQLMLQCSFLKFKTGMPHC